MKALVLESYNKLVYKEVENPAYDPGEVLIRVKACGICGSDVHGMDGSTGRRQPPLIMGHEASGEIVAVGKDVIKWKSGDRVTFDSTVYKLDDWYTREGLYNLSDNREVMGVASDDFRRHGAFAEYVAVPEHILYKIPEGVSYEEAAMVEPAAVSLHAINRGKPEAGETVVVVGAGMIGIFLVKILSLYGLSNLVVVDINKNRLDQALNSGASLGLNASDDLLKEKILKLSHLGGADLSFEVVGKSETVNNAINILRKGGRTVLVGNLSKIVDFPLQKVVTSEISVLSSCAIRGEYEPVLSLIEKGMLNVKDQISAVASLSEGASWFEQLRQPQNNLNKVILVP